MKVSDIKGKVAAKVAKGKLTNDEADLLCDEAKALTKEMTA